MRCFVSCLALALGMPVAASAQAGGPLLSPATSPGDRITVTTVDGAQVTGRLLRDGAGTLVLGSNDGEQPIPHAEINRVTRFHNRFLFGPLIGLGAGLAVGVPAKQRFDNEAADGNTVLAWSVGLGLAVGALIDLVNGSDRTIYARPGPVSRLQFQTARGSAEVGWAVVW